MLNNYMQQVQRLVHDVKQDLFDPADLVAYINVSRGQIAADGACIRYLATVTTTSASRSYNFSSLSTGTASVTGITGVINVRSVLYASGTGFKWVIPRPWAWFQFYSMSNTAPASGAPATWAQFGQGAAGTGTGSGATGSFYLDPIPDAVYTLTCDSACYPQTLSVDSDVEAIPYLWTDAVPYFAAYLALLTSDRKEYQDKAMRMFDLYKLFTMRARGAATPLVNRYLYEQSSDMPLPNLSSMSAMPEGGGNAQ